VQTIFQYHGAPYPPKWHYTNAAICGFLALLQALLVVYPSRHRGWTGTPAEIAVEVLVCIILAVALVRALLNRKQAELSIRLHNLDVFSWLAIISAVLNDLYRLFFKI
jgi:hypothetical protein